MQDKLNSFSVSLVLKIAAILLTISFVSLICSYFIFSSESWNCAYNTKPEEGFGWIIEFLRSVIWVGGGIYLVGFVLRKEAYQLVKMSKEQIKPNLLKLLKVVRWATIAFSVIVLLVIANQQYNTAPDDLKNQAPLEQVIANSRFCPDPSGTTTSTVQANDFETYKLPYLWYSPYAFINFLFIGVPLVSLGIYAAIKDLIEIQEQKNSLQNEFMKRENIDLESDDRNLEKCDMAVQKFIDFGFQLIETVGRYSSLLLVLALVAVYEYYLGRYTLSKSGIMLATIGYGHAFLTIVVISITYFYYTRVFHACSMYLHRYRCSEIRQDFDEQNNIIRYLVRTSYSNLNFYIAFILLLSIPPVRVLRQLLD